MQGPHQQVRLVPGWPFALNVIACDGDVLWQSKRPDVHERATEERVSIVSPPELVILTVDRRRTRSKRVAVCCVHTE